MKTIGNMMLVLLLLTGIFCRRDSDSVGIEAGIRTEDGQFNWQACKLQEISIGLNKHPYTESLLTEIPKFEELTGIKVTYNILAEEEYFEKLIIDLSTGSSGLDLFMTGPQLSWGYIASGWIESLDHYFEDPDYLPDDYDFKDFYPSLLRANRWNNKPGKKNLGLGGLWAIPIQVETYIIAYRKDLASAKRLSPPKTYEELYGFAREIGESEKAGRFGIISRGLGTWPTINTGFITGFSSSGCTDFDENMKCRINSTEAVEFTKIWIDTIKDFGPPDWPNITWYDAKQKFSSGEYGIYPDCDFFAASYENPDKSNVVGKVGYALPPAGPDGTRKSNLWTWSLAMNSHSKKKLASWLFLLWATSKEQLLTSALNGNMNPTRKSVWESEEVRRITDNWKDYREVVNENLNHYAAIQWTPEKEFIAVGDRWAKALHEIWSGKDAQKALDKAAADIDRIISYAYRK